MAKRNAIGRDFYSLMFDNTPPAEAASAASAANTLRISEIEPRSDQLSTASRWKHLRILSHNLASFSRLWSEKTRTTPEPTKFWQGNAAGEQPKWLV